MSEHLSLTDLFLVGLALDITGAWLLAKGLLISPAAISNISATLWGGNPETARDRCSSRVDAEFGVAYLAGGFLLQAVGYSLEIGGVETDTGATRLVLAIVGAIAVAAISVALYRRFHLGRVEKLFAAAQTADNERREAHDRQQEQARCQREQAARKQ
jgi:hypothetical protein